MSDLWPYYGKPCPDAPHRTPQGPNEDLAQCLLCGAPSHELRPEGETYGDHLPDCSLPRRHEGYCKPGGTGHPTAEVIRGYWPGVRAWLDGLDQAWAVSPLYAPSAGEHPSSRTTTPAERESFVRNESRAAS